MTEVELRFAIFRVHPNRVETVFPDGKIAHATRGDTPENRETAVDLGYTDGPEGVARALVWHEALHSILSDLIWQRASRVLLHFAGAVHVPYYERVYEESVVLGFERSLNTGEVGPALQGFPRTSLDVWRSHARGVLANLGA